MTITELPATREETQALLNSIATTELIVRGGEAAAADRQVHLAKYVIVEDRGREYPILFSRALQHSEVVGRGRPVSAGFYQIIDADHLIAFGDSSTLNLKSRGALDALLIQELLAS